MGNIYDRGLAVTNDTRKRNVELVEVDFRVLHEDRYAGRSAEPDWQTVHEHGRELRIELHLADHAAIIQCHGAIRILNSRQRIPLVSVTRAGKESVDRANHRPLLISLAAGGCRDACRREYRE